MMKTKKLEKWKPFFVKYKLAIQTVFHKQNFHADISVACKTQPWIQGSIPKTLNCRYRGQSVLKFVFAAVVAKGFRQTRSTS